MRLPDSAIIELRSIVEKAKLVNDTGGVRTAILELAVLEWKSGYYADAIVSAIDALNYFDTSKHHKESAILYNCMGCSYLGQTKLELAYRKFIKAAHFSSKFPTVAHEIYNNMATTLGRLGQGERALTYLHKSLEVAKDLNDTTNYIAILINISNVHRILNAFDSSLYYIDKAIIIASQYGHASSLLLAKISKIDLFAGYGSLNELSTLLRDFDMGDHFEVDTNTKSKAYKILASAYIRLGWFQKAEKSVLRAQEYSLTEDNVEIPYLLSELYAAKGNFKGAYTYFKKYKEGMDSTLNKEVRMRISGMELLYRTAEQEKRIAENQLLLDAKVHQVETRTFWLFVLGVGALLLAGFFIIFYRNVRQKQRFQVAEQENMRLRALIEGEEQERTRISGELHDGIGGILSAAKMSFSGLKLSRDSNTQKYVQGVQLLDDAYKELRRTAHNLSPVLLKKEGLIAAIESFCNKIALAHTPEIRFQHFGDFNGISEALGLTTYRIIQELVHNAIKHAQADDILVQLRREGSALNIAVEDDGTGIHASTTSGGIGLENVQVRVRALHGTIDIDSREGAGTTVYVLFEW